MFYRMLFDRFVDVVFCTLSLTCLDKFNAYVLTHDAVLCFVNNSLATENAAQSLGCIVPIAHREPPALCT